MAQDWATEREIQRQQTLDEAAIDKALSITPVLRHGSGGRRQIALTFDDGPSQFTPEILSILAEHEVPATFFVIGGPQDAHGALIKEEIAQGHVVANHTTTHAALDTLSPRDQAAEIDRESAAIELFGKASPRLFRPPYNSWNQTTLSLLKQRDMLMVLWSVETNDWAKPGSAAIVESVLTAAHPGAIVLFHDGGGDRTQTVEALPQVIEGLREQDYELVTIPQLLRDSPPERNQREYEPLATG